MENTRERSSSSATLCPKNVTTLSRHNSVIHELVLIIFGKDVTAKVGNQKVLYFSKLNSASAIPEERQV